MSTRITYLVNQYPKVSHTFVRTEIEALERLGFDIQRVAIRGWDAALVDARDEEERRRTRYLLRGGALPLLASVARALLSPAGFVRGFALALRAGAPGASLVHRCAYFAEACRLADWMREFGSQHLHAHFGTNPALVAMIARRIGGPGFSFTVHGPEEFDHGAELGIASKVESASFVVAVSSFGRSQLYRLLGADRWLRVRTVHCGIDSRFRDAEASEVGESRRLVCVGRLCEQKGQLILLEAAARVAAGGMDLELVLVGDGEMRGVIEEGIARLGLTEKVRVTGWLGADEVRAEILSARAFVLPSFAEGLPVALMEAMALRRPVVTTWIAGIPELVRDGEHGWLVAPGSVEDLALALEKALRAPLYELRRMGARASARALERHDADREAAKLATAFREAIACR